MIRASRPRLAGLVACLAAGCFLPPPADCDPPEDGVTVLVAARDLAPGTVLERSDLRTRVIPVAFVSERVLGDLEAAEGQLVKERVLPGEMLRLERLADPDVGVGPSALVPRGLRAVQLPVDDPLVAELEHGSFLDVYSTDALGACLLLDAVSVLRPAASADDLEQAHPDLWVLVDPEALEQLGATSPESLSISVRNPIDYAAAPTRRCGQEAG